jgi:hypothetical protein
MKLPVSDPLYQRVRAILASARSSAARSVNTAQVVAYWFIGREIVEEEQKGRKRAGYGEELLLGLSKRLTAEYKAGYSFQNLKFIRQFYVEFPGLAVGAEIGYAPRSQSGGPLVPTDRGIRYAPRSQSWRPGQLHPNLSWTHYRTLLRVDKAEARREGDVS